jgi:hypothetical protein
MQKYYWTWVTQQGETAHGKNREREGNLKRMCLMCLLYKSEYSNLKLAETTMGRGPRSSEEGQ